MGRIADARLVLIAILICVIAAGLPLLLGTALSFSPPDGGAGWSLQGYRDLMSGGRIAEFGAVMVRALAVAVVTMLFAVPSAYWLARISNPLLRSAAFASLVAPWFVSDMLRAFGWQLLLSPAGPISDAWTVLTGGAPLEGLRYNRIAAVVGIVSSVLPAGILSVYSALPGRSRPEWDAADELGAARHVFRLMTTGWARLGVVIGAGSVFILSCYASAEPRFLDGPTQSSISTIAASLVNAGVPALLAFSTALLLFMIVAAAILGAFLHMALRVRRGRLARVNSALTNLALIGVGRWRISALYAVLDFLARRGPAVAAAISILVCCAPSAAVAIEAFWQPGDGGRWTLGNFALMWQSAPLREALVNSSILAAAVTVCVMAVAFLLSLVVWNRGLRMPVVLLLGALVIMPGDAYGLSLVQGLRFLLGQAEGGWLPLILAHTLWSLPIATASLILANRRINPHVLEAALEYARCPTEVLRRMLIPINRSRLVGVALIGCTLSLNESVRTAYLSGGLITIGNEVHGRLIAGLMPENRGIFAVEFLVFVVSVSTLVLLARIRALDPSSE